MVNKLWLALEWYIPMLLALSYGAIYNIIWLALHVFDVALKTVCSHIRDDISSKQASKQEHRWWGLLQLVLIVNSTG